MSEKPEVRPSQFADWFNQQLSKREWTQGRLISKSGAKAERLSSAAVSRYSTGKMAPDAASCQKIADAFDVPVELVLYKAGIISTLYSEADWLEKAIDNLGFAVEAGELSEEAHHILITLIRHERLLQKLRHLNQQHPEESALLG
jgi:transcriptional regulator with XRE-family HTH domain